MARRALLVGAGGMGKTWAKNLIAQPGLAEIAGWVDIRDGAAREAADALELSPSVYTGTDVAKALTDMRPDFLVDVTIPEAHHDVTLAALRAGVPVLGEKPMAASMTQARAMVRESEKQNVLYMVSQSRRYDARIDAYRALVKEVGPLGILNSDFYIGAHFGGFRDEMAHVLVLDMAIHTFDAARFLCNQNAVSVYCEEFNPSWSWYKGASSATVLFEMESGLRYTYRGSWCAEGLQTSWEAEWRAVGPYGTAKWNGDQTITAEVLPASGEGFTRKGETKTGEIAGDVPGGIKGSLQDFCRALSSGNAPMGECHDNIKSLEMVFGAIESAQTGKRVYMADL